MMTFGEARRPRRPNLTPMIDVVFLLLVFFMLASRFGVDRALPLSVAGQAGGYSGPPRLVELRPEGITLNGIAVAPEDLPAALARLGAGPEEAIILRARDGIALQALVTLMDGLAQDGYRRIVLVD
jgi:biopolymer transport protein ExbD